ncbi:pyridoxamine 5'-phosphate oxidase family protein [Streptomyces sp. NRRL F-4489]|uniref:pyridoxamine 5'-phosphate oxidase family protein n=1 Tax=Streptomyces sp. NRRL F-4489 TaxID=1609095 RepID=UPI00099E348D|nr:pyridoxamine 5'-phosphate oxidase family protein [Streptomyces sp. NRRL F-4489]
MTSEYEQRAESGQRRREGAQRAQRTHGRGWAASEAVEPEFAAAVRERFGAYRHHVLATLRKDGSPRLSGLEADFRYGELWLGMMIGSRKALDLRRDPRFALHANPGGGTDLAEGDVRLSGRAVEVTDPGLKARYAAAVKPPEPFHLYRAELTEVVRTSVEPPFMKVESWRPGRPLRTIRRTSEDPGLVEGEGEG